MSYTRYPALSESEKRALMARLADAWVLAEDMRLGMLIDASVEDRVRLWFANDHDLVARAERFAKQRHKGREVERKRLEKWPESEKPAG